LDYDQLDDGTLMRRIAEADPAALGALYDRYGRLVYSLAAHIVNDDASAEEITQDVFVQVWKKAQTYRPEQGKVATWLTSVTRYRAIDILRRSNVRPEGHRVDWEDGSGFEFEDPIRVEPTIEMEQERRMVREAMTMLPPEQLEALAYAYFMGYSHQQIAQALGQPLGTVKTRIRLAMLKLRELIKTE
jgi:RNA polymerase sigma-70 factor (ECF subfamily)